MVQEMESLDTVAIEGMSGCQHQLVRYRPDGIGLVGLAQPTTTMLDNTPRDDNVVLPISPSTSSDKPTSKKTIIDLPQELMDSTINMMLPWVLSTTPYVPEDGLALSIDGADAFEAAYSLYCIGFKLPTITVQWIKTVLAKQWKLQIGFDPTRLDLNLERKSRSKHGSLLKNFRSVIIPLYCGPDHIICKRLHYHRVIVKFHGKFRHGRWVLDHVDWIGTAPSFNDIPVEHLPLLARQDIEEIAGRALSSCGRTYFASGLVQRLLSRIEKELQPKTPITKKLKLTDLPQELIDKIINESLPEKMHVSPGDSEALVLDLTLDDMTDIEVAYSLRSLGVKLPTPAEAWMQAIEAKRVALVVNIHTSLIKVGRFNKEGYKGHNSILRKFRSIVFDITLDSPRLYAYNCLMPGFTASFHLKFQHGRWVLMHTKWSWCEPGHSFALYAWHGEPFPKEVQRQNRVEDIVERAIASCGKTCTAEGLVGRVGYGLKIESERAEQILGARFFGEMMKVQSAKAAKIRARNLAV